MSSCSATLSPVSDAQTVSMEPEAEAAVEIAVAAAIVEAEGVER
jgi:hypothetical protein